MLGQSILWMPPDAHDLLKLVDDGKCGRAEAGRLLLWLLVDRYFDPGVGLCSRATWFRYQRRCRELGVAP